MVMVAERLRSMEEINEDVLQMPNNDVARLVLTTVC
jgi:hypothetical protein